jgi:hypothetical protein
MTKQLLSLGWASVLALTSLSAHAQTPVALGSGTSYTENFNGLATGLPAGFGVYTAASRTSLGTAAALTTTPGTTTAWSNTGAGFKNFASATGLASGTATADQTSAPNRALGVRQSGGTVTGTTTTLYDPGASFVFKVANTSGRASFGLTFLLQSLDASLIASGTNAGQPSVGRTTTWTVDYSLDSAPTTFITLSTGTTDVTTSSKFASTPVTVNFGAALNDLSGPVTIRISALTSTTGSGNRPTSAIDDLTLSWTPTSAPRLSTNPTTLAFNNQPLGSTALAKSYQLTPNNLADPTTITASGPFVVSKDGSAGSFGSQLTYQPSELTAPTNVYVRFVPTAPGAATGSLSNVSGPASASVALSGSAYDPSQTTFNFDNCSSTTDLSDGWQQYSVSGPQTWACTTFGRDRNSGSTTASAPYGVQINGFASGANVENQDWLISPSLDLRAVTNPTLTFWARSAFTGPGLAVRVSTNYSGSGDPSLATWTTINAILPTAGSDVWTQVGGLDLNAFKASRVYVALVYTSGPSLGAARWTIDDVSVTGQAAVASPALAISPGTLFFGNQTAGTSNTQSFTLSVANAAGNVTVSSSNGGYLVAKNGGPFASSITLTPAELNGPTTIQVKFAPGTAGLAFNGTVTASTAGATAASIQLNGDSYDLSASLEVVDWNMEWFGSEPSANVGPTNKDLQQTNVTTVLKALKADVFILQEVVSLARTQQVVAALSAATGINYGYSISDFGSYGDNPSDPDYAADQKLTFIYNTAVVSNPSFAGLLRCAEADKCAAYYPWASGRFPYMMTATVTLGGVSKLVRFINIHAKANSTATSASDYQRRKDGADLLKAYLDANYPNDNILIAGDYNDVLRGTIASGGAPTVTSYSSFVNDQANYVPITLALADAGAQSTASYPTLIDNTITSNEMGAFYIPGSAAVRTDITSQIASYATTTSDHFPVLTRYSFSAPDLVISTPNQVVLNGIYNSITVTSTGSGAVQAPVAVNGTVTVEGGGRLDTNCQPITGAGTFTVADGATLGICDANGIATTGSTGAVQVAGTRSFSPAASYVYNGTSAQVTGAGLPAQVRALSTTNASTLTLTQPLAVAQTLTLASSGNVALNNQPLTLLSSASGTALVVNNGTGAVTGTTAAVQRYLDGSLNAGLGYRQLTAPVSGSTVADLTTASFSPVVNPGYNTSAAPATVRPYPTVYGYDESRLSTTANNLPAFSKGWFSPASLTEALAVGKGYTMNLAAGQVVDFVGTLNNGDYTQALTRQNQTADGGWQLLGNPYPAPLDWSQVLVDDRPGLDGAVYVSQSTGQYAGTYRSYVNGVGNPVLPMGQGFFARISPGTTNGTLALHNTHRVTTYATQVSVLRTAAETRPRLNLTLAAPSGNLDGLYVYAEAGATAGFDAQQDAAKLLNTSGLNLAALTPDGQPLSIQGLAALTGRVALRVQTPAAGTYTLAAAELLNLPAGTSLVLEDTQTGQRTPLAATGAAYSFTVAAGDKPDGRFWLNLSAASPLATQAGALQAALTVFPNPTHDGQATLLVPTGTGAGQVQVLDALGRLVRHQALAAGGSTTLKLAGLPAGVYVVRVQTSGEQATRRLTIN